VARRAGAGAVGHRRPVASRSVRSALGAPIATSWTTTDCRGLIGRLADENRLWGAPRIHGELLKLGIVVSERTVSRYLRECPRRPSQTWRTFLANHLGQFTCMSPVMSPYASGDDVVDAAVVTSRSTPLSDRLSASSQCVLVDWRASVPRTFVGSPIDQDHFRDRTGMRRSAGRAPPRNRCVHSTHGGRTAVDSYLSHRPTASRPRETVAGRRFAIGTTVIVRRDVFVWSAVGAFAWQFAVGRNIGEPQ